MANVLQYGFAPRKRRFRDLGTTMVITKTNKPRVLILPLVTLLAALLVVTRYSTLNLQQVATPIYHAETNQSRIPRVFVPEQRTPNEFQQNEQTFKNDEQSFKEETRIEEPLNDDAKEPVMKPKFEQTRFCDKRSETDEGFCIFDVGLNNGQDTMQYLEFSPKARIVAVEANPTLVKTARNKFSDAVAESRLKLLNIGLVGNKTEDEEESPKLEFWINKVNDVFSSFKQRTGCRDATGKFMEEGDTTFCRKIEMETKSCSELIKEYGTPLYMKIDIEGLDRACLQSLGNVPEGSRPKYASIENVNTPDIDIFTWLGYRRFKVVNQNVLQVNLTSQDMEGHSGPWGEKADDFWIGKKWHTREELLNRLPLPPSITIRGTKLKGWYDLHAKM